MATPLRQEPISFERHRRTGASSEKLEARVSFLGESVEHTIKIAGNQLFAVTTRHYIIIDKSGQFTEVPKDVPFSMDYRSKHTWSGLVWLVAGIIMLVGGIHRLADWSVVDLGVVVVALAMFLIGIAGILRIEESIICYVPGRVTPLSLIHRRSVFRGARLPAAILEIRSLLGTAVR